MRKIIVSEFITLDGVMQQVATLMKTVPAAINKVKGINFIYGCVDLSRTPLNRMATDSTPMIPKK